VLWDWNAKGDFTVASTYNRLRIWEKSPVTWDGILQETIDFKGWWNSLCLMKKSPSTDDRLQLTSYLLWEIWKARNQCVFEKVNRPAKAVVQYALNGWLEFSGKGSN
ncbi:ribonuclease H-like superfamily protein, partial [Striga asiatica]